MQPLHNLLSRIRWDRNFGRGAFALGYYDRVSDTVQRVNLQDIIFEAGNRQSFLAMDNDGNWHRIPFHRVREVYKDGELIWQRP